MPDKQTTLHPVMADAIAPFRPKEGEQQKAEHTPGPWHPEHDRCCCHIHQDPTRGLPPKKCSLHGPRDEPPEEPNDRAICDPLYGERMDSADLGEN